MKDLIEVAKSILINNLNVNSSEQVLVVTDSNLIDIAEIFYVAGLKLGNETVLMKMKVRSKPGEEPSVVVSNAMKTADVVLAITEHSLTHTNARKQASIASSRIATMPGITWDMLQNGAITADYQDVTKRTNKYCQYLDNGETIKILKENTSLTFSIKGRKSIPSTGMFKNKGESGNLPSGESYIAPLEESANGTIKIDGAIAGIGVLTEPTILTLENGRLVNATGAAGKQLLDILGDGNGRIIAEFGIGTNKKARLTGNILEDEKVFGTVHIAFGSNKSFGGIVEAGVHIDCIIKDPVVFIDEVKLLLQ